MHTVNPGPVETPGFPQRMLLSRRVGSRLVLQPERIAETIVRAVERNRAEVVVPRYLRVAGAVQALAPGTLARLVYSSARASRSAGEAECGARDRVEHVVVRRREDDERDRAADRQEPGRGRAASGSSPRSPPPSRPHR